MQSSALKKQDYSLDDFIVAEKLVEVVAKLPARARDIAAEAEAACNLPGNQGSADFEAFAEQYGLQHTSAFA